MNEEILTDTRIDALSETNYDTAETSDGRSSTVEDGGHVSNWRNIIWREWRNCGDDEYAQHLFALVVNEPTKWWGAFVPALLGAVLGALGGWLVELLYYPIAWYEGTRIVGIFWGPIIGGGLGILIMLGLHLGRRPTWGMWMRWLLPTKPLVQEEETKSLDSLSFQIVLSLTSGMGIGVTGAVFFGQANSQFYYLLGTLVLVLALSFYLERWTSINGTVVGIMAGAVFSLFFGLGFAQLAGLIIGPFDLVDSGRVVGLATGVAVGLYLGRGLGLTGLLLWQVIVTIMVMAASVNIVLVGWLVGLLFGGIIGSLSRMWIPSDDKLNFAATYRYRTLCFWWLQRPFTTQVEAALRSYPGEANWVQPLLQDLETNQKHPPSVEALTGELRRNSIWQERFVAWHTFLSLGHEALPTLMGFSDWTPQRWRTAKWLVRSIGHETTIRLADKAEQMICPDCLTACGPHEVNGSGVSTTYYGCRVCGQSREFLPCPEGVVAVLDANWKQKRRHQNGLLRVNWLENRELFDFDRVEIIGATDEDAERFAVQVGNDTDPLRKVRYPQMQCVISPGCDLSENTLRVLRRTFGTVAQEVE